MDSDIIILGTEKLFTGRAAVMTYVNGVWFYVWSV